ncbi:MAG: cob(I)yrinic acid a,c-diamide adenosyltransferase [Clostridia bacterium]|nr:cob(I)yrinic acid a,c-diamide adenosyltransferase [Clostridia bacterium]
MQHKLHLYYGDGKGKTTCGMGLALRFLGHGKRVLVAQFMKDGTSGELDALRQFQAATIFDMKPVAGFLAQMEEAERQRIIQSQTEEALKLTDAITKAKPDLVLLDELALACAMNVIPADVAQALIHAALVSGETVVTGYAAPDWLKQCADYVTHMTAEKHPYRTEGLAARECVEW